MVWRIFLFEGPRRWTLTISQQSFAEELSKTFSIDSVQNVPIRLGVKLDDFSVRMIRLKTARFVNS